MKKKSVPAEELDKLKLWFEAELKRRDKRIEELDLQNKMLLKSSLKQSERNIKWSEYAKQLERKIRAGSPANKGA